MQVTMKVKKLPRRNLLTSKLQAKVSSTTKKKTTTKTTKTKTKTKLQVSHPNLER